MLASRIILTLASVAAVLAEKALRTLFTTGKQHHQYKINFEGKQKNVKDLQMIWHCLNENNILSSEVKHTLVTAWSHVTRLTMALPVHRVTAFRTAPALTQVGTIRPPASHLTR